MNREILDKWCERSILGLTLVMLVVLPLAFGGRPQPATGLSIDFLLLDPFLIAELLVIPLVGCWLIRIWLAPKTRFLWPPVCWAVIAFTLYAGVRYVTSDVEYAARQEVLQVLLYALVFFAVLNNLHRQESTQIISFTVVFLAMVLASYAIYQYLVDSNRVWHVLKPYSGRSSGTFISPNHLGCFLELALPLGLAYTVMGRVRTLSKVFLGYASLVIVVGIATTQSRGAWVATAIALAIFFAVLFLNGTYRLPSLVFLVLLVGAVVLFLPRNYSVENRIKQLLQAKNVERDVRYILWKPALAIWRENPWWGVGPAHFDIRFRQHRPESVQLRPDRVHNDYLNTLADWGVMGTALVTSAWVLVGIGAWKTWRFVRRTPGDLGTKRTSNKFAFVLGATMALAAILVHSLFDFNMHVPANALLTVVIIALLSAHLRFASERYWLTLGTPAKAASSMALCGGIVFIGLTLERRIPETLALAHAQRSPNFSPQQVDWLKKAHTAEPRNWETAFAIGEALRIQSAEGTDSYEALGEEALKWFSVTVKLNRWSSISYSRSGWCLDWLDRSADAGIQYAKAEELEPNGYFIMANIGYHYIQIGNFAAAKPYLERSIRLQYHDNPQAHSYLALVRSRMLEASHAAEALAGK
jgi:O-antigen ligase